MRTPTLGLVLAAVLAVPAVAQDPLPPEEITVKAAIDPGPNVYVYQESLDGPGTIAVFGADDLVMKGTMPSGSFGTMFVDPVGRTAYAQSTFLKRYAYGDMETVLQIYDVATLTPTSEVILPPKGAMALSYAALLQGTADGRFMLVQNATPASSVTVVDLADGTVAQEIPTPGCWGVYPFAESAGFMTVCGDGSFMTYALSGDGKTATETTAEDVFDPDGDPVFATAAPVDGGWAFVTFGGSLIHVAAGPAGVEKRAAFSFVDGVEGGWAPGGYNLVAYSPELKRYFVTMHSGAYDGSHKNPSEEIWAIDLEAKAVAGRAPLEMIGSFTVGPGPSPALFALALDARLLRFDIDLSSGLALAPTGEVGLVGYPFLVAATP